MAPICTLQSGQRKYLNTGGALALGGPLLHLNSIAVASGAIVSYFSKKFQILAPSSHYFVNYYPIKVGTQWQLKANICFRLHFRGHMFLIHWYTLKSISTLKKKSQQKYFITNLACFATDLEQWLMSAYQRKPHKTHRAQRAKKKKIERKKNGTIRWKCWITYPFYREWSR